MLLGSQPPSADCLKEMGGNWRVAILPQIGYSQLDDQLAGIDRNTRADPLLRDQYLLDSQTLQRTAVGSYICPSEPSDPVRAIYHYSGSVLDPDNLAVAPAAIASYVGSAGTASPGDSSWSLCSLLEAAGLSCSCQANHYAAYGPSGDGMFHLRSERIRLDDVLDGTAHTLMVGELTVLTSNAPPECGHPVGGRWIQWMGVWAVGSVTHGLNYPCRTTWWHGNQFGSYHPGGVNFALADGSVRFLADTLSLRVLVTLATRNGNDDYGNGFLKFGKDQCVVNRKELSSMHQAGLGTEPKEDYRAPIPLSPALWLWPPAALASRRHDNQRSPLSLAVVLALACSLTGCGGSPSYPETCPTTGLVTFGGQPLTAGVITYAPVKRSGTKTSFRPDQCRR